MKTIEEMRQGIAYVGALLRELDDSAKAEEREFTEDEDTRWLEGESYVAATAKAIEREERRAKVLETAETAGKPADGARDFSFQRQIDTDRVDVRYMRPGELRDGALKVLEREVQAQGISDERARLLSNLARRKDGWAAARLIETESDAYREAFMKRCLGVPLTDAEARAMNITTTTQGGFGVPIVIDPTIRVTDQGASNPFWAISDVQVITTKDWRGVTAGGVTFAFETESAAANDLTPTLAQPVIHAHRIQGAIPFSIEVEMDYPEFAANVGRLLEMGYDEKVLEKFTIGTGSGEPWGVFEACEQATSQVVVDTDAQLHAADVNKLWAALPQRFRQNASWMMSADANGDIQALGDDKLSKQTNNLKEGWVDTLKGRPVYESAYAPSFTGTTGAASIAVLGDFSNFVIAQRAGMNIENVQHLVDTTTGLPTGQRALFAWARVGSDIVIDNAFRMLVNT